MQFYLLITRHYHIGAFPGSLCGSKYYFQEVIMRPLETDLSVYKKFNFEKPPVGIKYLFEKPEGIEQIDKSLALCEMLKEAHQRGAPFYFTKENESCVGKLVLGMIEPTPGSGTGHIGVDFEIFQDARANRRLYRYQPNLEPGIIKYVVYSPLDTLTFEPDLLLLMTTVSQAEIVMRALSYSTGEMWSSKLTSVGACTWLYAYPYLSGEVNYAITGMSFGMKAKEVFPEGWMLISIPYQWIPTITHNLNEMKWVLPSYTDGREKFMERERRVMGGIVQEPPK
jgi:uncharacterized protein (DUF169 family)